MTVIGVYRPAISKETWREQFQVTGDEQVTREHFEKLVLIEAVVEGLTGRFDFSKFGQVLSGYHGYPDNMQVGYDEGLLSADGETLIQRRMHSVQGTGTLLSPFHQLTLTSGLPVNRPKVLMPALAVWISVAFCETMRFSPRGVDSRLSRYP